MDLIIIIVIFLGLPILSLILFLVSLVRFLSAPKGSEVRKNRKGVLIASAIIAGVLISIVVSIIILFMMSIANM